jgi:ubiquinol-cytochrome c reductase cytochrome b subunit
MNQLSAWLEERTGWVSAGQAWLAWSIPGGPRWRYVFGVVLAFLFLIELITGLFLWLAYSPSTLTAWESVYYIEHQMTMGWFVRGLHHYAAQAMMVVLGLHVAQVIICGAYRAPRELVFWSGLALIPLLMVLAQTGYLLPWDQRGQAATKVATSIAGASPVIGPALQQVAQGGPTLGHATLTRFFALHAGLLPLLFIVALLVHRYLIRRQRLTSPNPDAPAVPYWPYQAAYDAAACCMGLAAVVAVSAYYGGADLGGPAGLADEFKAARPEWYFLPLFRLLRFEFVETFGGLAFGGIYVPTAVMLVFVAMPFVAKLKHGHRVNVAFLGLVGLALGGLTALAVLEDAADRNHLAAVALAERDAERAIVLASTLGIPPQGAGQMMRDDPLTQGPRIFAAQCAACHHYNGHDGTGRPMDPDHPPTAADLGKFGNRDWLRDVLVDYHGLFAPLQNLQGEAAPKAKAFLEGDMASWSNDNREALLKSENTPSLAGLIEFLVLESGRKDLGPVDTALAERGMAVFSTGTLEDGTLTSACTDCHTMQRRGATEFLSQNDGAGVPMLTGYAGEAWLKEFIRNPAHSQFYGEEKNLMPGFADRMSEKDLDLLVKWLVGEYARPSAKE